MANPTMKLKCTNPDNRFFGEEGIGHIRPTLVRNPRYHSEYMMDLAFCVQLNNTNDWHIESRQDWSNTDAKRPQTQDQRRSNRRTNGNVENERLPTQTSSSSIQQTRSKS